MNQGDPGQAGQPVLLRWIGNLAAFIAALAFLVTLGATLLGVFARHMALSGMEWTFEAAAIAFLWTSFFGVLLAEVRRENVALTLISNRLKGGVALVVSLAVAVATLWLTISLFNSALAFAGRSGGSPTPVMRLPRLIQIMPVIVFAGGAAVIVLVQAFHDLRSRVRA